MRAGLVLLTLAYVFSQFFRSFLAVLTEVLKRDIGATPQDLASASGVWFLTFAAMQIPVGLALDKVGPRRTAAALFLVGGAGGSVLFAMATAPVHVSAAMFLIGIGCSPVLMASYFIFARVYPAAMFATLGAVVIGVGSLGNLAGAGPRAWAVQTFGWRETLMALAVVTAVISAGIWLLVQDPPVVEGDARGSLFDLLKLPALWLIFPLMFVNYAPAAGLRGLWIGPYLLDVHGATESMVGLAATITSIAMIIGTFAYGPLDRMLGTRKWVVVGGLTINGAACALLATSPGIGPVTAVAIFAVIGFTGMAFPLMVAHGRSFVPPHLAGRGVTLLNLFGIGGVGAFQMLSGRLHEYGAAGAAVPFDAYQPIFVFLAVAVGVGLVVYLFSQDRLD
jgi:MFS family permease